MRLLRSGVFAVSLLGTRMAIAAELSVGDSVGALLIPTVIVIVTGVAALWLVRNRQRKLGITSEIAVMQSVSLGPRERLLIVQVGDERLLLGATASSISLIMKISSNADTRSAKDS